jgi:hypothetical protein
MEELMERRHMDEIEVTADDKTNTMSVKVNCRFESRGDDFHQKVCDYYCRLADPDLSMEASFFYKRLSMFVQKRPGHPLAVCKLNAMESPERILSKVMGVIRADLFA